jgi:membrane dipeptidase
MNRILLLFCLLGTFATASCQTTDQALALQRTLLTVDSHTDTPLWLTRDGFDFMANNQGQLGSRVDYPRMKAGSLDAVFFAVFVGQGKCDSLHYISANQRAMQVFDSIHALLKHQAAYLALATTPKQAFKNKKANQTSIFIGVENGYPIGKDLKQVQRYYDLGARYITLCHTKNNDICDSSTDTLLYGGLSEFGIQVVKEMNRLGMMIDISHASDQTFYDVLKYSDKPIIASHSCSRALCDNPRNLSDSMLVALAKHKGVIQMCILSDYVKKLQANPARDSAMKALRRKYNNFEDLSEERMKQARTEWQDTDGKYPRELATVADACDHIDHIVKVAGIDYVGIGTDFDGGGGLADCANVAQLPAITRELMKRGYSKNDLAKLWGGNLFRVMKAQKN